MHCVCHRNVTVTSEIDGMFVPWKNSKLERIGLIMNEQRCAEAINVNCYGRRRGYIRRCDDSLYDILPFHVRLSSFDLHLQSQAVCSSTSLYVKSVWSPGYGRWSERRMNLGLWPEKWAGTNLEGSPGRGHCSGGKEGKGRRAFIEGLLAMTRKKIRLSVSWPNMGRVLDYFEFCTYESSWDRTIGIKLLWIEKIEVVAKLYTFVLNVPCILPKNETVNRSIESK